MATITIFTGIGIVASQLSRLFGGFDYALQALVIVMVIDYLSGLMIAGVKHNSPKTVGGSLSSTVGFKGLAKKACVLLLVMAAHLCDRLLEVELCRLTVIYGFFANEIVSLIENAVLLNIPIPDVLKKAVDMVKDGGNK